MKKLIEKTLPALPGYAEMKSAPDNMHTCAVCKFWYPNAEMTYGHCVADLRISRGTNGDGYCDNFKYRGRQKTNDKLRTLKDLHEKAITEILNDGSIKDLDKMLTKFGEQNGYPVIFVVTAKTFDPPKEDIVHSAIITNQLDIKCFKSNEMHEAADYAQKVSGILGAFDPRPRIDSKEFQKQLDKQKRFQTVQNNAMIEHFNKMVEKYKLQDLVTQVEATGQNEFTAILPFITAPEDLQYYYNNVICHLQQCRQHNLS